MINLVKSNLYIPYRRINKNKLIYKTQDRIICTELPSLKLIYSINLEPTAKKFFSPFPFKELIVFPQIDRTEIYKESNLKDTIKNIFLFKSIFDENLLFFSNRKQKEFGKWDLKQRKEVWKINYSQFSANIIFIYNNFLFLLKESKIVFCLDKNNGTLIWQKDLSLEIDLNYIDYTRDQQTGKVKKAIGVYNEELYLAVNNDAIVSLKTSSGAINRIKSRLEHNRCWKNGKHQLRTIPFPPNATMIGNNIVGLANYSFWKWNIQNDNLQLFDCEESFKNSGIFAASNIPYLNIGEHLIFGSHPNKIIVFNIFSGQIDHVEEVDLDNQSALILGSLSCDDRWIIINDTNKNSHIFEYQG